MQHSFDIDIAKQYGIEEAIILNNLYYWIEKNKANGKHFYNDNWWTYNSKKAFTELFPYMSERKIDYVLNNLIEKGLIIKGNYNTNKLDRTCWYAITKNGYCILQNCEMENTKSLNDIDNTIYNNINNTNINKQIINTNNKENTIKEIFDYWNSRNIIKHNKLSAIIENAIKTTLKEYSVEEIKVAIDNYSTMLNDKNYKLCDYIWSLDKFLRQKNALSEFVENGAKWLNYKNKQPKNKLDIYNYTDEELIAMFDKLDEVKL